MFSPKALLTALFVSVVTFAGGLNASATTTDIAVPYSTTGLFSGSWVNANNGSSIVSASTSGNTGTGITFGNWAGKFDLITPGQTSVVNMANVAIGTSTVVNTLFNTFYGDIGTDAVVTFTNSANQTQSFNLIGNLTVRDYNQNSFSNTLLNGTPGVVAQNWFSNGAGQRLDVQSFRLMSSWAGTNLVSMSVANPTLAANYYSPQDVLSAVQVVSNAPPVAVTPEPSSLILLGTGVLGVAATLRKRMASISA